MMEFQASVAPVVTVSQIPESVSETDPQTSAAFSLMDDQVSAVFDLTVSQASVTFSLMRDSLPPVRLSTASQPSS